MGGLGNYLFQISAAFNISLRDNKKLIIDSSDIEIVHQDIETYKKNIFRNLIFQNLINKFQIFKEESFHFKKIPHINGPLKLNGYFQSEKYFSDFSEQLLSLYRIDNQTKNYLLKKYNDFLSEKTCSLHVRRGNYLKYPKNHPVLSEEYYRKSISYFDEDTLFLVFSDDIEWCISNLSFIDKKIFITDNQDFQDLYLMSLCKNNIIANSSFSWWGAWLNENNQKKVIAPKSWFGDAYSHYNLNDLYCDKWMVI